MDDIKTYYVKLNAKFEDFGGYITYVFENKNFSKCEDKYIMCVQFPNWDQNEISINDVGYINVRYVEAGVSRWYDGENFNVYKYTNIIFLKFIKEKTNVEIIVD